LAYRGSVVGAIALALLIVGLYGTLAAAVVRGRRELGIRLALGASPRSVRLMVVARGLAVALFGLVFGLPLSYVFTKSFAHLLYGVQPVEPAMIAAIVATVLLTAIIAAYLPARHAARRSSARTASGIARLRTTSHPNCGFPVYNAVR
jgi:ABC-type antimicrobial peptide transport system permease subunit